MSRTKETVESFDPAKLRAARLAFDTTTLDGPPPGEGEPRRGGRPRGRQLSHDRLVELVNQGAGDDMLNRGRLIYFEQGKRTPGIHVFKALADALRVDPFDLMTVDVEAATLADLRAAAGISRADLAERLGLAYATLYKAETGERSLQQDVATKIARILKVRRDVVVAAHQRGVAARTAEHDPAVAPAQPD